MWNPAMILDDSRLQKSVPSAFALEPWHKMSERYKFVPTIEVINLLRSRGFFPVRAAQSRTRIPGKGDFTKHVLRFQHENNLTQRQVGDEIPELVLTNSHDGTSTYNFMAGIFRLVCLNGLTVRSADFGEIKVKHMGGDDFHDRIIDATYQIVEETPKVLRQIESWKQIELTPPDQQAFAAAALELKNTKQVAPEKLLTSRRDADKKSDLWTTTNVIQENLIKGGLRGRSETGRRATTRAVKSVGEDLRLNRALWLLAEKMAGYVQR